MYYSATEYGATSGYINATSYIEPRGTYLNTTLATASLYNGSTRYGNIVTKVGDGTTNLGTYWLASRCVLLGSSYCWFRVRYVNGGSVYAHALFDSGNDYGNVAFAVRPVVEIPLSSVTLGVSGAGTAGIPFSLTGY